VIFVGEKKFCCPECDEVSTALEINQKSAEDLGDTSISIVDSIEAEDEDALVVCPKCNEESYAVDWDEVEEGE
jgi:RNA polymerase subunit RPABC4/transcription elongation factor Spt4